jgi:hypothetical protein
MSALCTNDLRTHRWTLQERTLLSLPDIEGFYSVFLIWGCPRCARRVWADGVIHQTTPPLSPVEWEQITQNTRNPWQQQVERHRRAETQREYIQETVHQWTAGPRRHA